MKIKFKNLIKINKLETSRKMLREIFNSGFIDKNRNINKNNFLSPVNSNQKVNRFPSFKTSNTSSKKNEFFINKGNKPIMGNKINMIMNRPDYLLGQNNESTMPTTTANKQYIYSNEITKNLMTPKENENLNLKKEDNNIKNEEIPPDIIKNIININNNSENNSNSKENNKNQIQTNQKLEKQNELDNPRENNINNNNINNLEIDDNLSNIKNKSIQEKSKSFEINLSDFTSEGIDKLKILEEYICQIKENSTNINEIKIEELQKSKKKLENNVNILSSKIRTNKKKVKNNIKLKNDLELEKEKVLGDSNKANQDAFSLKKELPSNRVEIEIMKNQIAQIKEETKGINNYADDIERQTMEIKDELKKINVKITKGGERQSCQGSDGRRHGDGLWTLAAQGQEVACVASRHQGQCRRLDFYRQSD